MDPFSPGLLRRLAQPPRRVALLGAFRIGDFLCATPGLRALRAALPGAEITFIGLPVIAELAARNPHIDRFEPFPGFPGIAEQFFEAPQAVAFLQRMQQAGFDLAVQMHGSGVYSNPILLMMGARVNAGFVRPGDRAGLLDAAMAFPDSEPARRRALRLAVFLGAESLGEAVDLPLAPEDHARAAALLTSSPRPWIGLHPGSCDPEKIWPARNFMALGSLFQNTAPCTVVALGGPGEVEAAAAIAGEPKSAVINAAGRLSVPEMAAAVASLDLLVSNDSGPAHMAYALGVASITLFGATDPAVWGPPESPRHVVLAGRNRSVANISPLEVFTAAHRLLPAGAPVVEDPASNPARAKPAPAEPAARKPRRAGVR